MFFYWVQENENAASVHAFARSDAIPMSACRGNPVPVILELGYIRYRTHNAGMILSGCLELVGGGTEKICSTDSSASIASGLTSVCFIPSCHPLTGFERVQVPNRPKAGGVGCLVLKVHVSVATERYEYARGPVCLSPHRPTLTFAVMRSVY